MTPDVQKYYEDYFELFSTDGWKQLMQDVEGNKETFKIESIENNCHRRRYFDYYHHGAH